jgi:hypothetical protein
MSYEFRDTGLRAHAAHGRSVIGCSAWAVPERLLCSADVGSVRRSVCGSKSLFRPLLNAWSEPMSVG